jgi:methylmalonyl-CoA mutase, N-terminal domain
VTLTAQQPLNNVVRVTVQALAAVLGGTQSLHTNAYDEALALPTPESAKLALRTQQVLAHESGAAATVDPLGGSYYVEWLTDSLESAARDYLAAGGRAGRRRPVHPVLPGGDPPGGVRAPDGGGGGDRVIVGVNAFREDETGLRIEKPDYAKLEAGQRERLAALRRRRDDATVARSLDAVRAAARGGENLLPPMVDAVRALATLGEISDVLREEWGEYRGREP